MSIEYVDPLTTRYATKPMLEQFAEKTRMILWRKLWLALAESEKELGLNITDEQISFCLDTCHHAAPFHKL